jgi:hypothetical protein
MRTAAGGFFKLGRTISRLQSHHLSRGKATAAPSSLASLWDKPFPSILVCNLSF